MIPREVVAFQWLIQHLTVPYKWGGDNPLEGLDCSGLVNEFHKSFGLVPRDFDATAQTLFLTHKKSHDQKIESCVFGDLVFYGKNGKGISHVAICLDDLLMLEAGGGNSRTTSRDKAQEHGAWVRIRPIKSRKDLIGFGRPKYPW